MSRVNANTIFDTEKEVKNMLARMTPMEKWLMGRGGIWEFKNGRHYDPELKMYVLRCWHCKHYHLAKQPHKLTCGEACKKARQRQRMLSVSDVGGRQLSFSR